MGGEDLALAVGSGKLKGRNGRVLGEGMKRAGPHRERDGEDSFLATADSIRQATPHSLLRVETYTQQLQTSHLLCG